MTNEIDMMRVAVARGAGAADVLAIETRPVPAPVDRELLVEVFAAGVNRPDIMQRMGAYAPPPGANDVLGLEMAGEVIAVGDAVTRYRIGDTVMGLVPSGGYATRAIVDERHALPVPTGFSFVEAAAIPETFFTVWANIFHHGQLREGSRLLLHGGTSGIGTTAIQLGAALGVEVMATAGSDEKCRVCEQLGAVRAINYRDRDFVTEVMSYTAGKGVDVVLDMVGAEYVNRNLEVLAFAGQIVQIAFMRGHDAHIDLRQLMSKRAVVTGSNLRPRSIEEKEAIARDLERRVAPLWLDGQCRPVIDSTFAFDDVVSAHERMDAPHVGKVVLSMK